MMDKSKTKRPIPAATKEDRKHQAMWRRGQGPHPKLTAARRKARKKK